jgi:segregation and condensation protein A
MAAIEAEAALQAAAVPEAAEACDALNEHDPGTYPVGEPRAENAATDTKALVPEARLPSEEPEIPSTSEAMEEPAAATPLLADETTQIAETASAEEVSEPIEIAGRAEPEETTVPKVQSTPEEESTPAATSGEEPEAAQATEAATAEETSEPIEIAAESALEETTTPEPAEEPAAEVPSPEIEPSPADEPAQQAESAAAPPTPESSPGPQEIAPTLPFAEKHARTTAEKVAAALKAREARGEDAEQSPFNVMVNEVYDGPLDLLLDLIRKQDIDIYDIPIAKITAQFLAYVDRLRSSDMDVAGEFIYTAALLIHIKSKMLLPRAPAGPDDAEDPRRELVERLLEHERFKNAAQMLHEKQMLEAATWTNPGIREFQEDSSAEPEIAADTTDLVRVFNDILERARNRPIINVEEDSVTVGQMIQFLARRLTMEDRPVALRRLLSHTNSERALIAMFLALLELVRLQAILLRQDRQFSEIFIKKHTGFEALMNQGLANARDDWR